MSAATKVSQSLLEASTKARRLYRHCLRQVPLFKQQFELDDIEVGEGRARVRAEFMKHADITDPVVIDMLVFRGSQELEEARMNWKQKGHLMTLFDQRGHKDSDFLQRFYAGRD